MRAASAAVVLLALALAGCSATAPPATAPATTQAATASSAIADHTYRLWVVNVGITASGADMRKLDETLATADTVATVRHQITKQLDPTGTHSIRYFADVRSTNPTVVDACT